MTVSPHTRDLRGFASEIKFLVDPGTGAGIREWARSHLDRDPYGVGPSGDEYQTSSLYFDTPEFDVYQRRESYGRSKLRIRRYDGNATVFLERKLRRATRLNKRRTVVDLGELARLADEPDGAWAGAWFARRAALRRLRPVCQITYRRTARVAPRDSGRIRLTIDEGISSIVRDSLTFAEEPGQIVVPDHVVLELKYHATMPSLFKQLVEEFRLAPARVSKYRMAAEALGFAPAPGVAATTEGTGPATYA